MPWSADAAMWRMWAELPKGAELMMNNNEMFKFLKDRLQAAFDAGVAAGIQDEQERDDEVFDAFNKGR